MLACGDGITSTEVARQCRTSNQTVCKWRKRFVEQRLDGLYDEPRVGAPRKVSDKPILPMDIGQPERRTHNYVRHGTLDLFAALNVATGKVIARCTRQHRSIDFVAFLREIDKNVPDDLDVHVIVDNLSAHKSPVVKRWLSTEPLFSGRGAPSCRRPSGDQ